jgi:hypothetical protein
LDHVVVAQGGHLGGCQLLVGKGSGSDRAGR